MPVIMNAFGCISLFLINGFDCTRELCEFSVSIEHIRINTYCIVSVYFDYKYYFQMLKTFNNYYVFLVLFLKIYEYILYTLYDTFLDNIIILNIFKGFHQSIYCAFLLISEK